MPLLLLLLLSDPTITSQTRDADHHVIVAEFGADLDRAALQAQLQREAERLCAGRHPRFGEYRFQTDQPIEDPRPASTRTRVEQDLSCVEQGTVEPQMPPPAPSTPVDTAALFHA